jgi:L-asparaginase
MRNTLQAAVAVAAVLVPLWGTPMVASAQRDTARVAPASARVHLVATGGTISNRAGGRLTAEEIAALAPGLERVATLSAEQFSNTASGALTLAQYLALAKRLNALFREDSTLSGLVVSMGTDTMEELAWFLHLTVRDPRPVVVVGAMRNPSQVGFEGPANFSAAVRVAADPAARGVGTVVVLNDEINSAREVAKTDARRLHTFSSGDYGVLGVVDGDRVAWYRRPIHRHSAASEFDVMLIDSLPRVDILWTYQGAPGDLFVSAADAGASGIVAAVAGAGALSGTQGEGVRAVQDRGVFVATAARAGSGRISGGAPAVVDTSTPTGRRRAYALSAEDHAPLKARLLLMLGLATTRDVAALQRMFREY